ncbi:MAG: 3,4-dihydroxy-2-butanone-4-phosphate synthase [Gammaproteobacteria bacterium]
MNTIDELLDELRAGRMVVVMDDEGRENEGDLIMAAEKVTAEQVAFIVRYTSGIICQPMTRERLEELRLPQMVAENTESHRTAFTVSVDYVHGTSTGISAADRARTIRALADATARPEDFSRPGHIFPLRYADGGVLRRAGHTEASVDLVRAAGLAPTAIICEVVNDDGTMKRGSDLSAFANDHNLKIGTIADLIRWRLGRERTIQRLAEREMSTEFGPFRAVAYRDLVGGHVHLALIRGEIDAKQAVLVRVHVQNTLSDVGVRADELGLPVRSAMERVAADGGVVVVLRGQETDGALVQRFGDEHPIEDGRDEAAVLRTYGVGAQILADIGVQKMRVLSAPKRMHGISGFGLEIVGYENPEES